MNPMNTATRRELIQGPCRERGAAVSSWGEQRMTSKILGVDVTTGEDGAAWLEFWHSLVATGLSGLWTISKMAERVVPQSEEVSLGRRDGCQDIAPLRRLRAEGTAPRGQRAEGQGVNPLSGERYPRGRCHPGEYLRYRVELLTPAPGNDLRARHQGGTRRERIATLMMSLAATEVRRVPWSGVHDRCRVGLAVADGHS